MLLGNYTVNNKNPGREFGGSTNLGGLWKESITRSIYASESFVVNVSNRASLPNGYRGEAVWLLAPKAGGMSTVQVLGEGNIGTAQGQNGYAVTADLVGSGTISDAAGGLIVEILAALSGSGSLDGSISGALQALADLSGSGTLSADAGALAGLVAALGGSGTLSGEALATGLMAAEIFVNQSEAQVQQIVDAVWSALAAEYNVSGTMGNKLNGAGSAGDPWSTDLTPYITADTAGLILKQAKKAAKDAAALSA